MCSEAQVRVGAGLALTYPVLLLLHLFSCHAKGQSSGAAGRVSQNLHRQISLSLPIWLSALCTVVVASLHLRCMKYLCGGVTDYKNKSKQDPVSTMQKTGWTKYSSFLVWSSLEKGFTYRGDRYGSFNNHFLCIGHENSRPNKRTNNRVILVQACS